jgi:acid phosphatase family membrane protein YuiD
LNTIRGELFDVFSRGKYHGHMLNERIGHTLPELLAGIVIGVIVTSFLYMMM